MAKSKNSKKLTSIKRQSWGGKYYYVLREQGRVSQRVRATKGVSKEILIRRFKKTNSIRKGITKQRLKNVTENVQPIRRRLPKVASRYQIAGTVTVDNKIISARSMQVDRDTHVSDVKDQAYTNLFARVSGSLGKETDFDDTEVLQIMERANFQRIYYAPNTA